MNRGPGGTRWISGEPGEQTVTPAFDAPQTVNHVLLQVEEPEVARTQDLLLSLSCDERSPRHPTRMPARMESP